jgi:hypothetical protein
LIILIIFDDDCELLSCPSLNFCSLLLRLKYSPQHHFSNILSPKAYSSLSAPNQVQVKLGLCIFFLCSLTRAWDNGNYVWLKQFLVSAALRLAARRQTTTAGGI